MMKLPRIHSRWPLAITIAAAALASVATSPPKGYEWTLSDTSVGERLVLDESNLETSTGMRMVFSVTDGHSFTTLVAVHAALTFDVQEETAVWVRLASDEKPHLYAEQTHVLRGRGRLWLQLEVDDSSGLQSIDHFEHGYTLTVGSDNPVVGTVSFDWNAQADLNSFGDEGELALALDRPGPEEPAAAVVPDWKELLPRGVPGADLIPALEPEEVLNVVVRTVPGLTYESLLLYADCQYWHASNGDQPQAFYVRVTPLGEDVAMIDRSFLLYGSGQILLDASLLSFLDCGAETGVCELPLTISFSRGDNRREQPPELSWGIIPVVEGQAGRPAENLVEIEYLDAAGQ